MKLIGTYGSVINLKGDFKHVCCCKTVMTARNSEFVGMVELGSDLDIGLFNCPNCHSSRGVRFVADSDDKEQKVAA